MGRISEILTSGRAPGVRCGASAIDPQSVYAKAPQGLREMEAGGGRKRSARPIGAREISKHFGMSVDKIKEVWSRPPLAIVIALFLSLTCHAGDLVTGETLVDGQTVHASDLNQMVNGALIQSSFYTRQSISTPATADYLVSYSVNGYLYRATLFSFLSTPFYQALNSGTPSTTNQDLFCFFSVANTNLQSITFSNLLISFSAGLNPALWNFAPTNSSGLNIPALPNWVGSFSGLQTNNQPFSLHWGSNGVPYQLSLSNEEKAFAADIGTNYGLPYTFIQVFEPWLVYGTNTYNFTNAWGTQSPFLITNLWMPNSYNPSNAPATLLGNDTIPVNCNGQQTNTAASLAAVGQFVTNSYPFGFTLAKINFSGVPLTITTSNLINTNYSSFQASGTGFQATSNYCVSFSTSGNFYFNGVATNTAYYVVPFATNANWMRLYSSYANAAAQTNWISLTQSASGTTKLYYLTNYASFNSDVIQTTSANAAQTGEYDIFFRTAAQNALYYVTGTCQQDTSKAEFFNIDYPTVLTSNKVRVVTAEPNGVSGGTVNTAASLVHSVIFN